LKELEAESRRTHKNLIPAATAHLMVHANLTIITRAAMDNAHRRPLPHLD